LDYLADLAKESLLLKREHIEKYIRMGLYPYSKFYMADIEKRFGELLEESF